MSKAARILLLVAAILGVAAAVAYADATIYAGPPNQFVGGDVTIDQGQNVTFTNADTVTHDVTAKAAGPDGKPLFGSEKAAPGSSVPVNGVQYLTTGTYDYICSIHPFMTGTITVTSAGKPAPRPGGGGGGASGGPSASSDTTAPTLSVKVLDTKRSAVRKRRSLQVAVTSNEKATVSLTARSRSTVVASGNAVIPNAGTKKASLKLTKAGLRMMKRAGRLRVTVAAKATDSSGNAGSATASGSLR